MTTPEQPQARHTPEPSINFGNVDTAGGNFTVSGDNNEDNSTGKTHNEVHGNVESLTSHQENNFDSPADCFRDLMDELAKVAPEISEEAVEQAVNSDLPVDSMTGTEPLDVDTLALEPLPEYSNNEDHPVVVSRMVSRYAAGDAPLSVEEEKGIVSRLLSCFVRYATDPVTIATGKMALAGMRATASLAPPFNIIVPVIETGIKLATGDE